MQTAKLIYISILALVVIPLIAFNLKRIFTRKPGEKMRFQLLPASIMIALIAIASCFLFFSYQATINNRYEIAAERYGRLEAKYLSGMLDIDAYMEDSKVLRITTFDESGLRERLQTLLLPGTGKVRFQISDWIIPKYYAKEDAFPETQVTGDNNPVFILLRFDLGDGEYTYELIRMTADENQSNWKIDYHGPATEEQVKIGGYALPSEKNGQWFNVS